MGQYKRIFIVGHSGAGKGFLAQELAKKLGWQFIDADYGMSVSIGRTLNEILGKQGEDAFQHCLAEILTNQINKENIVVVTDDSLVCDEKSRQLLSAEFTVHLKVSLSVQLQRISLGRPLLLVADYKGFLEKLRQERDGFYEEVASYSLSSDNGAIDEHVANILKALEK